MKVVIFEGNPKYLSKKEHGNMIKNILDVVTKKTSDIMILPSDDPNMVIPEADVYIGFSRGSRYLRKCDGIKVSIGGITGKNINYIRHPHDNVSRGDLSPESLDAHFTFNDSMKKQLSKLF